LVVFETGSKYFKVEAVFSASTLNFSLPLALANTHHPIGPIRDAKATPLIN
jgi:hypothetical protein